MKRTIAQRVQGRLERMKVKGKTEIFARKNARFITDDTAHLERTLSWIKRAQDANTDGGVSRGNSLVKSYKANAKGWQPSYPETTGYIIPTMLTAGMLLKNGEYVERAKRMGEWELAIQFKEGGVHGGNIGEPSAPAVFDTGQVLRGYLALYQLTNDVRYKDAAQRAIAWIQKQESEKSGRYVTSNAFMVNQTTTTYMVYAIAPLADWGILLENEEWKETARRSAEHTLSVQEKNGWFRDCDFHESDVPLLHTLAYTIDGLWDIGVVLNEPKFVDGAQRALDAIIGTMGKDGYIAGRFDKHWKAAVSWECLTGIAQIGVTAMKVYQKHGDEKYKHTAQLAKEHLKRYQNNFDEKLGGGIGAMWGSWPISGGYGTYQSLNWAAKYFADLLLLFLP